MKYKFTVRLSSVDFLYAATNLFFKLLKIPATPWNANWCAF